jgi:hypothetical protein
MNLQTRCPSERLVHLAEFASRDSTVIYLQPTLALLLLLSSDHHFVGTLLPASKVVTYSLVLCCNWSGRFFKLFFGQRSHFRPYKFLVNQTVLFSIKFPTSTGRLNYVSLSLRPFCQCNLSIACDVFWCM